MKDANKHAGSVTKKHYMRGYHPNSRKALARSRPRFSAETAVEAAKRSASTRRYLASLKGCKALVRAVDNAVMEKDLERAAEAVISLAKAGNLTAFRYLARIVDGVKL